MGRELRRVPLDFDWPLNKVWDGYLSPGWRSCPSDDCENGSTIAGRWLECLTHLILMAGDSSVDNRPLHPWLEQVALAPTKKPGPQMQALTAGLAGRAGSPLGHDAIDRWKASKAIAVAAGLAEDWGICKVCGGHAIHPDDLEASEAWEGTEPPTGDGFQLWETTSEGSPVSPVFDSLDALCAWAATNATTFASARASAAQWKSMLDANFVHHDTTMLDGSKAVFI